MTIRHKNVVIRDKVSLELPEDAEALKVCLQRFFPDAAVRNIANQLFDMFLDEELAMGVTSNSTKEQRQPFVSFRTLIFCRSAIRKEDWLISRQVICIACSLQSLAILLELSGNQHLDLLEFPRNCHTRERECYNSAIKVLNLIRGSIAADLACTGTNLLTLKIRSAKSTSGTLAMGAS
jgi:hypothetical protein